MNLRETSALFLTDRADHWSWNSNPAIQTLLLTQRTSNDKCENHNLTIMQFNLNKYKRSLIQTCCDSQNDGINWSNASVIDGIMRFTRQIKDAIHRRLACHESRWGQLPTQSCSSRVKILPMKMIHDDRDSKHQDIKVFWLCYMNCNS